MRSKISDRGSVLIGWRCKNAVLWLVLAFLVLALRGTGLLSRSWENAGMTTLGQAVLAAPGGGVQEAAARAEALLRRAVTYAPDRRSVWRGLGFALAAQGREDDAVAAWQTAGGMAGEFMQWGEQARGGGRFEEGLIWYERATEVEPQSGDTWYYMGLTYERMERWEEALGAYERATTAAVFTEVGRSSSYYHIGVLCEQRLGPPQVERALSAFEAALAVDDFSSDEEAADCHYRRGAILWREGRDPQECIAEFQRAVELNHRHVQAHILLGVAYYAQYGDAVVAEAEIREALELSPREKWAYVRLGDIHRQEGRIGEAAAAYERALEIDPNFEAAQRRLQALNENE